MGTRSRIGIERDDGIASIYVHWDGYPESAGAKLHEHYRDLARVEALIALGDLSVLGPEIGKKHDFDAPHNSDWCLAYGRDRGEEGTAAKSSADLEAFSQMTRKSGGEYAYLFAKNGQWMVRDFHRSERFEELATVLARLEAEALAEKGDED